MDAVDRPRLGRLLVEKGLITEADLVEALRIHEQTGKLLGEILTEHLRVISAPALADVLLLQQRWRPLGAMLVEDGLLSEDKLLDALDEQERTGKPLGEVVRSRFYVSSHMLDALLEKQRQLEIELERGYATGLRSALLRQGREGGGEEPEDSRASTARSGDTLGRRVAPGEGGMAEPHFHLALKAVEHREGKIDDLRDLTERQRMELDRLRDELADRQLTIIELEQRVLELQALVAARA
ncbi:MAG: hypothetical protein ICV64_08395 [Thermoleophilia bacterium]|nr:hypothetical protein [Thermoleophilia bacterium]